MATGTIQKNMVLLWTNPSPSSSFASQKVAVDLSKYGFVGIEFNTSASAPNSRGITIFPTNISDARYSGGSGVLLIQRNINTIASDGITFGSGYIASGSSLSADNSQAIPYKIYGLKL